MPNPEPQPCGLCEYKTPAGCPTWRDHLEALRLHVETFHRQDSRSNDAGAGAKMEKLPRPKLKEEISDADWNYFCAESNDPEIQEDVLKLAAFLRSTSLFRKLPRLRWLKKLEPEVGGFLMGS